MSVAGIVLAAGSGTRYGGPKALAATGDRTWLEIVIATLQEGGCEPVIAVLGASAAAARAAVRIDRLSADTRSGAPGLLWIVNDAWPEGRTGSLQRGLGAAPNEAHGAIVHAVDHPDVHSATIRALVAAHPTPAVDPALAPPPTDPEPAFARAQNAPEPTGGLIFLPSYQGRRGHPVLLSRAVWPEVFALAPDEPLWTVVHRDPARVRGIDVDDASILRNRNERQPEDRDAFPAVDPE